MGIGNRIASHAFGGWVAAASREGVIVVKLLEQVRPVRSLAALGIVYYNGLGHLVGSQSRKAVGTRGALKNIWCSVFLLSWAPGWQRFFKEDNLKLEQEG